MSHSADEIVWFVRALVEGRIEEAQAAAWLMAAYLRGLDSEETLALTLAMARSGDTLSPQGLPHPVIDKHSTGGVGDAITPLFLPIMAACGVPVVKMSGRGLGHTGGTIDKLERIPGFRTDLSPEELVEIATRVGCALGGQTQQLAPADKILYSLRDRTATVDSVSLIAASVMSKKLAADADVLVLDVKAGNGAFMKTAEEASLLAQKLVEIGTGAGKTVRAFVTDMNQPLANAVGDGLEVRAAIRELATGCKNRLGQLATTLCDAALELSGKQPIACEAVESGAALQKMGEWIAAQGGDASVVENDAVLLPTHSPVLVTAQRSGYVKSFATAAIGAVVRGANAGLEVHKRISDRVEMGEAVLSLYAGAEDVDGCTQALRSAYEISDDAVVAPPLIHAVV